MKANRLALLLASSLIATACSQSEDPLGDTCKQIASALTGNKSISWENPARGVDDGELRIDLSSPQTTASCFFKPTVVDHVADDYIESEYENAPYKMLLNGNYVPESELLKASVMAMSSESKKAALKAMKEAREKAQTAAEKSREAAAAADKKIREMMDR